MKTLLSPAYNRLSPFLYNSKSLSVVTVSEYSKQYLLKHSVSENIINVIYNGIPLESSVSQKKSTIRQNWGFSKNEIIIGAVSRLEPIKGIKFLIQAFSSFSKTNTNARLVIAGDGPQKKELEDTATSLGIKEKVKFLGLVRDVDNYLNAIDIYILPSLHENHSLALLEAMRVGKAIVATSVGGNTESVRHESEALIIPPKDTDALTKTLIRLSKDQTLASNLSFAAKQRFESHFTLENMLNKTATWLQQCCHLAKDVNIVRISN
jgi:glycosyltransferase involved in cell wall biosynthesis